MCWLLQQPVWQKGKQASPGKQFITQAFMQHNPARIRAVQVQSWQNLSPHLRRIVFHSPDLADYPFTCNGAPFKLLLPRAGQGGFTLPDRFEGGRPHWNHPQDKPQARTYTVRGYDAQACTLTVDFVLHGDNGPASAFAERVAVGQTVGITAPKGSRPMLQAARHYLLVGDLTALPAMAAMLEQMDEQASGNVLLLVPGAADVPVALKRPPGLRLQTFVGASQQHAAVVAAAEQCRPPDANAYVWLAAEADLVARLRPLVRQQWGLPAAQCYAVPYWREGEAEESYHSQRHAFMDSED